MSKYIDPSKLVFNGDTMVSVDGDTYVLLSDVRKAIAQTPSEDVVPRTNINRDSAEGDTE